MPWAKLRRAVPWLVLAGCFAALCYFEWRNVGDLLDSDMASDLIYARLLAQEGTFFSPNWYYSSELRVFANHLSFTPLFLITQDWRLVRCLSSPSTRRFRRWGCGGNIRWWRRPCCCRCR